MSDRKEEMEQKFDTITNTSTFTIPYIVFENSKVRAEKRERRNFATILISILLLVATNMSWMLYFSQMQMGVTTTTTTVTQTVGGDSDMTIGDGNNGR